MSDNMSIISENNTSAIREAVLRLTNMQAQHNDALIKLTLIQGYHEDLLKELSKDREENTKFKAKVGGIVLATTVGVSVIWAALLAFISFWRN